LLKRIVEAGKACKNEDGSVKEGQQAALDKARADATTVGGKLKAMKNRSVELESQIKRDAALFDQLTSKLQEHRSKIARAEQNISSLAARHRSAKIRKEMAAAAQGIDEGKGLSALDALEKAVDTDEAQAEALEELAGVGDSTSIEKDYGGSSGGYTPDF